MRRCPLYIDLGRYNHSFRFSSTTSYLGNSLSQSVLSGNFVKIRDSSEPLHPVPTHEKRTSDLAPDDDRGSPSYHTPITGLTPSSSDDGRGVGGAWADTESSNRLTPGFNIENNKQDSDDGEHFRNRTPSSQSFSSAVDTAGSSQSLHNELFGGKPRPTITTSDVMARVSRSRSRSLSPRNSAPVSTSSEPPADTLLPLIESWEDWGSPENKDNSKGSKQEPTKLCNEPVEEESHSAGSGQFNNDPLHTDHTHFQAQNSATEVTLHDQLHKMSNGQPRIIKDYLQPAERAKKPLHLPRQVSAAGTVSPERYYSPMEPPRKLNRILFWRVI